MGVATQTQQLKRAREHASASVRSELFFGGVYGLGLSAAIWSVVLDPPRLEPTLLAFLAIAGFTGMLQVRLPRLGRVALTYPFVLASLLMGGLGSAMIAASLAALAARLPHGRRGVRLDLRQFSFGFGVLALATFVGGTIYLSTGGMVGLSLPATDWLSLLGYAAGFGIVSVAVPRMALAASPGTALPSSGRHAALQALPAGILGTALAPLLAEVYRQPALRVWLLAGPLIYVVYLLARARIDRAEQHRHHVRESRVIYQSVTRALTRAIAARDQVTEEHLWRVQELSVAVARRLELPARDVESIATAALLHDIGKIAVPDPILSKPGRLSPDEMARVREHPTVGADILETIAFPHAVHEVVRHHHERWDGTGYPDGLRGASIPYGARILSVVDCFDALTSNRPYRRALSHTDARDYLLRQAGAMFDPAVVDALLDCLDEGFAESTRSGQGTWPAKKTPEEMPPVRLPLAQRHLESLYDIARATNYGLELEDCLTLVATILSEIIPHRSLAVLLLDDDRRNLTTRFARGQGREALTELSIPIGERLSGWAALHHRAIIGREHETPVDRDGTRSDLEDLAGGPEVEELTAAVVAPLVADQQSLGTLALYDVADRRFTKEDRRILVAAAGYVAQAVQRVRSPYRAEGTRMTDQMTGLPNARFLWLEVTQRLAAREGGSSEFALLAFRVRRLAEVSERWGIDMAERGLIQIARRLAASCRAGETLVRFGQDLFVVLTTADPSTELVDRWSEFVHAVEERPLELRSESFLRLRLVAAHARYPEDGEDLDALCGELESRLSLAVDQGRTVVPFRARRSAS